MHSEYFDHSYEPYSSNSPFGIEEYIPEAQSSNIEDSDKEESDDGNYNMDNVNEISLKVDDSFSDWESVQKVIDLYAKQNGFVANKSRKDIDLVDKMTIRRSDKAIFHISLIHTRWFNSVPTDSMDFITVVNGEKKHTSIPLSYITHLRTDNVYTPTIKDHCNKKIQYGTAMGVAKTGIQVAIAEGVTAELIEIITQFIMKYRRNTGLNVESTKNQFTFSAQESFTQESFTQEVRRPLVPLLNVSNPEYHRPKGRPPKRLKSSIEESKNLDVVQRTCGYCSAKGHNIRSCSKYKATLNIDKENTINEV
uniref:Putative zinc finger protein 012R n=1 Tax=Anthurium amnicola TaxID=1678845 RepID=A0A1D1YBG6_9ARAE